MNRISSQNNFLGGGTKFIATCDVFSLSLCRLDHESSLLKQNLNELELSVDKAFTIRTKVV